MSRLTRGSVWVFVALALVAGCTAQRRETWLRDRAAEYVYPQPLEEIWPRVQAVMEAKGYYWRQMPGSFILETEWKEAGEGGALGRSSSKFLIEGLRVKSGGAVIRVLRSDVTSQAAAVHYAGRTGNPNTVRGMNDAMVDASNSNTTGTTNVQRRAYRDLELEWEFLKTIDPGAAAALEADSLAKYPR
jgi:hypothetical protein